MSKLSTLLVLLSLASLLIAHHAAAQPPTTPTYFVEDCQPEYGNYTNSAYKTNLKLVLTKLSLQAKTDPYSNTSAGTRRDTVYGQYYCRGDISTQLCGDCIKEAVRSVKEKCSKAKAAVMYYEECTLRYANQSMVGVEAEDPGYHFWGLDNVTDPNNFGAVLNDTRDMVVDKASNGGKGSLLFATGEDAVSQSETVYLLAQCSPDLNGTQCDTCLTAASRFLARTNSGGNWPRISMVFDPSCQIRYSVDGAFYPLQPPADTTAVSPAPSPLQPPVVTGSQEPASVNLTTPSTSTVAAANGNVIWYIIGALAVDAFGLL